jgi:Fe-S-cluster containining protein
MSKELKILRQTYDLIGELQHEVEKYIGVPICAGCGNCCKENNVSMNSIEAQYLAEWLKLQDPAFLKTILDRCEKWLTSPVEYKHKPVFMTRAGLGTTLLKDEGIDRVLHEVSFLCHVSPCPMMDNNQCLIHPARPTVCRTFGVTRVSPAFPLCGRKVGKNETNEMRQSTNLNHPKAQKAKANLEYLKALVAEDPNRVSNTLFIPTYILLLLAPERLYNLLFEGEIVTAKLNPIKGENYLWQEQMEYKKAVENEVGMVVEPMRVANGYNPETILNTPLMISKKSETP